MINLTNADSALRVYLDAITDQLNYGAGPFLAAIEKNVKPRFVDLNKAAFEMSYNK